MSSLIRVAADVYAGSSLPSIAVFGNQGELRCNIPQVAEAVASYPDVYDTFFTLQDQVNAYSVNGYRSDSGHYYDETHLHGQLYTYVASGKCTGNISANNLGIIDEDTLSAYSSAPVRVEASFESSSSSKTPARAGCLLGMSVGGTGLVTGFFCFIEYQGSTGNATVKIAHSNDSATIPVSTPLASSGVAAVGAAGFAQAQMIVTWDGTDIVCDMTDLHPTLTVSYTRAGEAMGKSGGLFVENYINFLLDNLKIFY